MYIGKHVHKYIDSAKKEHKNDSVVSEPHLYYYCNKIKFDNLRSIGTIYLLSTIIILLNIFNRMFVMYYLWSGLWER